MGVGNGPKVEGFDSLFGSIDAANIRSVSGSTVKNSFSGNTATSTGISIVNSSGASYISFGGAGIVTSFSNTGITGANSRTLSAWVKFTSKAVQSVMSVGANGAGTGFGLETSSTVWNLSIGNSGVATTLTYDANVWYHVAYVGEFLTSNSITSKLYINGVLRYNASTASINTTDSPFYLGTNPARTLRLNGFISQAKIYKKALSEREITKNYNAMKGRYD
jgi:hypothetical protein